MGHQTIHAWFSLPFRGSDHAGERFATRWRAIATMTATHRFEVTVTPWVCGTNQTSRPKRVLPPATVMEVPPRVILSVRVTRIWTPPRPSGGDLGMPACCRRVPVWARLAGAIAHYISHSLMSDEARNSTLAHQQSQLSTSVNRVLLHSVID